MNRLEAKEEFEKAVEWLRKRKVADFPLGTVEINGKFSKYMDSDTDSAFIGFCAGRLWSIRDEEDPTK